MPRKRVITEPVNRTSAGSSAVDVVGERSGCKGKEVDRTTVPH